MTKQIVLALVVLATLIGGTLAADRVVAAPAAPRAATDAQVDVDSGTWYCLPIVRRAQTATLTVAAVGDEPSRIRVQRVGDGTAEPAAEANELVPGETVDVEIDGAGRPAAVVVRWSGGPVVTSWRVSGDGEALGASCATSPAPRWLVTGATTTVGSTARVYLFNPFETDAVAQIAFATPEGRVDLVSSENLTVPARDVLVVDVGELQPEQPDLGMIVEVSAGRIITSAVQTFGRPDLPDVDIEGAELEADTSAPDGRALLHATAADATSTGFAYSAAGEDTSAWISVMNPNARPARVAVTTSDQIEGTGDEIVVGPESVERVDLSAVSSSPEFGVTLEARNDVSFVAQQFVARTGDDPSVAAAPGVIAPDARSVVAAATGEDPAVVVYNPSDADATVSIAAGGQVPGTWSDVTVPAGAMQRLPFADAGVTDAEPLTVEADRPVHTMLHDGGDSGLRLVPLVPANSWSGGVDALRTTRDQTLRTRPVDFPVEPAG